MDTSYWKWLEVKRMGQERLFFFKLSDGHISKNLKNGEISAEKRSWAGEEGVWGQEESSWQVGETLAWECGEGRIIQ